MANKVILDANIWIGYFNDRDSLHKQSQKIVEGMDMVYVPEYVVLESVSILKMKATAKMANFCLDVFMHTPTIVIIPSSDLFTKTISLFQILNEKHLSFVDVSLLALSRDYEVKTFDKKLAAAIRKFNK